MQKPAGILSALWTPTTADGELDDAARAQREADDVAGRVGRRDVRDALDRRDDRLLKVQPRGLAVAHEVEAIGDLLAVMRLSVARGLGGLELARVGIGQSRRHRSQTQDHAGLGFRPPDLVRNPSESGGRRNLAPD